MRTTIFTFIIGLFLISCTSTEVDEPQKNTEETKSAPAIVLENISKPVIFDYTSTGCPGCGSWGAPVFDMFSAEFKSDIVPIAVHIKYGDPMITPESEAIGNNRTGSRYTPQIWVDSKNAMVLSGTSINGSGTITNIRKQLNDKIATEPSVALGVSQLIDNDKLLVRFKSQTLKKLEGEYYHSVLILENDLIHQQNDAAYNPFIHHHVIRTSSNGAFGRQYEMSLLSEGQTFEEELSFDIDPSWNKDNLYVVGLVWKKIGQNYTLVNSNDSFIRKP